MKGKYYNEIVMVTEEEAWEILFDKYEIEIQEQALTKSEENGTLLDEEIHEVMDSWRSNDINEYEGFHLRDDGTVEVEA